MWRILFAFVIGLSLVVASNSSLAKMNDAKRQARQDIQNLGKPRAENEKLPVRLSDANNDLRCNQTETTPYPDAGTGNNPSRRPMNRSSERCIK